MTPRIDSRAAIVALGAARWRVAIALTTAMMILYFTVAACWGRASSSPIHSMPSRSLQY